MQITNLTQNKILARHASIADNFFARLKGLLGTKSLLAGEALLIRPCNSVHTFGMNYAIDVIFADADNRVVRTVAGLVPGRLAMCRKARYVVELPAGTLARSETVMGDILGLE